jgi:hypothetical protein
MYGVVHTQRLTTMTVSQAEAVVEVDSVPPSMPPMDDDSVEVSASGTIMAAASAVWATVADFGSVASYLPSVVDCRLEGTGIGSPRARAPGTETTEV